MAKAKRFAPLALIPFLVCIAAAQDDVKIISRVQNFHRMSRAWASMYDPIEAWRKEMIAAQDLLKERFNSKVIVANPDEKRKQTVAHYKAAKEALLTQVDALNVLIEEEDY